MVILFIVILSIFIFPGTVEALFFRTTSEDKGPVGGALREPEDLTGELDGVAMDEASSSSGMSGTGWRLDWMRAEEKKGLRMNFLPRCPPSLNPLGSLPAITHLELQAVTGVADVVDVGLGLLLQHFINDLPQEF